MNLGYTIRACGQDDQTTIFAIINDSAKAYRSVIPADRYHEPYMPLNELHKEIDEMTFFAYEENGMLGVVGYRPVKDVTLVRHLYVLPEYQRRGIGTSRACDQCGENEANTSRDVGGCCLGD